MGMLALGNNQMVQGYPYPPLHQTQNFFFGVNPTIQQDEPNNHHDFFNISGNF
jgi:hypothetical protein